MATYAGDAVLFLVAGYNPLSSRLTFTGPDISTPTEDITPFGVTARQYAAIQLKTAKFSHDGLYDDAALASNAALVAQNGVQNIAVLGVEGNTQGKHLDIYAGEIQSDYKRVAAVGKLTRAGADHQVTGQFDEGVIVYPLTTATPPTTGTSVDNGALTSNGGIAVLMVTALTLGGYTSITCKIQHSTDNSTWVDLATFTNVTAAPNAQTVVINSGTTVNRYLRLLDTLNGSGSSPSATILAGFARR